MWHIINTVKPIGSSENYIGRVEFNTVFNPFNASKPYQLHGAGVVFKYSYQSFASFLRYFLNCGDNTNNLNFRTVLFYLIDFIILGFVNIPVWEQIY